MEDYAVHDTKYLDEIKHVRDIYKKKRQLENSIVGLIKQFEFETGVAIDIVKYERDITIPLEHKNYYTDLKICISSDSENENEW